MNPLALLGLLKNPWVLLAIACAMGAAGTGWYRMRWEGCVAARADDARKAEQAKAEALQKAQASSDRIITEQAQVLALTAGKAGSVTERIIHVPVTTACVQSPAVRAAVDGVRDILAPGGGQADAGGRAPPAVPAAKAR